MRDPTKRKCRQGNKRKRGALEGKHPKKKTSCKRKGKGEGSTTEAMIGASQPSQEVEEVENAQENITLNESGMQYIGGQGYGVIHVPKYEPRSTRGTTKCGTGCNFSLI